MLKLVKSRPANPDAASRVRPKGPATIGRAIYLTLLGSLGLGLANYFIGGFLFFHADGLVIRDHVAIATTYLARITDVAVKEGEQVKAGDVLFRVESTEMLERLADLSQRRAELKSRLFDFQTRQTTAESLMPLADTHQEEATEVLHKLHRVAKSGLVTTARYEEAMRANYEASEIRVRLDADYRAINAHMNEFDAALQAATTTQEDLEAHYAHGVIRAPADGPIGAIVPSVGQVIRPGDTALTLYSGDVYVLAYLPQHYLFSVRPGIKVRVSSGRQDAKGVIAEILPISDALPIEFQNNFQPQDRNQLAKIRLDGVSSFPIGEKVRLSRIYF
jgi:multidrug resistance efflux pump